MSDHLTIEEIRTLPIGSRVRAFNPKTLGVVQQPTIVSVGRKYVVLDYGELWGGEMRVNPIEVIGVA